MKQNSYDGHLEIIGFKLRDIEQKFGEHEAKYAATQLHECICRFEMEATKRHTDWKKTSISTPFGVLLITQKSQINR